MANAISVTMLTFVSWGESQEAGQHDAIQTATGKEARESDSVPCSAPAPLQDLTQVTSLAYASRSLPYSFYLDYKLFKARAISC